MIVAGIERAGDERETFVARLREYERIRATASALDKMPRRGRDFAQARVPFVAPPPLWVHPREYFSWDDFRAATRAVFRRGGK